MQVFTNLIQNALKFTAHGHIEISVCPDAQGMRCEVSDTGPGIDPKDLPKVLENFSNLARAAGSGKGNRTGPFIV